MDDVGLLVADVYECAGGFRRIGEATAAKAGQTQARWQLLSVVSEEAFTVAQAARRLGIARQSVQRVANELVSDQLAKFEPNPDHISSPLLTLTPQGNQVLRKITAGAHDFHIQLAMNLGKNELAQIRQNIRTLNKVLSHITSTNISQK